MERNGTVYFPVPLGRPSFQPGQDVTDLQAIANTRYAFVTPQGLEFVAPPSSLTQAEKEALTFPPSPPQYATKVMSEEVQSVETPKASGEFPRVAAKKTSRNHSNVQRGRRASVAARPEPEPTSSPGKCKATSGRKMCHGKNKVCHLFSRRKIDRLTSVTT
ncbi:hypothetical protein EWM64_g530 [Hericium alpestre]|uniref:Uncharacterized protein n=1 Tax=Hericium alpestre TaxID=135208 RepID=A0A4Z0ABT5_9AGAM|nr:hypothetical protein EWM64_g530 [Hericium alpestre]